MLLEIIGAILSMVGSWMIFKKMGRQGWEGIVPIYSTYVLCKVLYGNGWKFLLLLIPFYNIYFAIKRQKAPARPELFDIYRSFWSPDTASLALLTTSSTMSGWVLAKLPSIY